LDHNCRFQLYQLTQISQAKSIAGPATSCSAVTITIPVGSRTPDAKPVGSASSCHLVKSQSG
jgi:hypothetical protein